MADLDAYASHGITANTREYTVGVKVGSVRVKTTRQVARDSDVLDADLRFDTIASLESQLLTALDAVRALYKQR